MRDFLKVFWQVIGVFALSIGLVALGDISLHFLGPVWACLFMLVVISLVITWQIRSIQKECEKILEEEEEKL